MKKNLAVLIVALIAGVAGAASAQTTTTELPPGATVCFRAATAPAAAPASSLPECQGVDSVARAQIERLARQLADLRGLHSQTAATANAAAAEAERANAGVDQLREELRDTNDRVTSTQVVVAGQGVVQAATTEAVKDHDARLGQAEGDIDGLTARVSKLEASRPRLTLRSGFVALAGIGGGDSYSGVVLAPGLSLGIAKDWRLGIELGALVAPTAPNWGTMLRPNLSWTVSDGLSLEAAYATYGVGLNTEGDSGVLFSGLELGVSGSIGKRFAINAALMPAGLDYSSSAHAPKYTLGGNVAAVVRF